MGTKTFKIDKLSHDRIVPKKADDFGDYNFRNVRITTTNKLPKNSFSLTILVLIVESHWTESTKQIKRSTFLVEQNSTCWQTDKYEVIQECKPCSGSKPQIFE